MITRKTWKPVSDPQVPSPFAGSALPLLVSMVFADAISHLSAAQAMLLAQARTRRTLSRHGKRRKVSVDSEKAYQLCCIHACMHACETVI